MKVFDRPNGTPPRSAPDAQRYRRVAMAVILVGIFMVILDSSIVNVSLPQIGADFDSVSAVDWIVTSCLLAVGVSIMATGWPADRFGKKRVFVVSLSAFTGGSFLCAVAPTLAFLVGSRVVQGLGGSFWPLGHLRVDSAMWFVAMWLFVGGLGVGLSIMPNSPTVPYSLSPAPRPPIPSDDQPSTHQGDGPVRDIGPFAPHPGTSGRHTLGVILTPQAARATIQGAQGAGRTRRRVRSDRGNVIYGLNHAREAPHDCSSDGPHTWSRCGSLDRARDDRSFGGLGCQV